MIATGWCDRPAVPADRPGQLDLTVDPAAPRPTATRPSCRPAACWSSAHRPRGVQLADELARAGRDVVLAVGRHSRLPRRYRGMDIFWWLERIGTLDRTIDELPDAGGAPVTNRRCSSPAAPTTGPSICRRSSDAGVELTGRLSGIDGRRVGFADDLPQRCRGRRADVPGARPTSTATRRRRPRRRGARPRAAAAVAADHRPPPRSARPRHHTVSGRPVIDVPIRGCTYRCSTMPARSASAAGHGRARPLCARPALPALPQLELHRRRRPRCRHRRRPPRPPDLLAVPSMTSPSHRAPIPATTTSSSSERAPPAPPRRCSSPAPGYASSSSTAAATAPTPSPPMP